MVPAQGALSKDCTLTIHQQRPSAAPGMDDLAEVDAALNGIAQGGAAQHCPAHHHDILPRHGQLSLGFADFPHQYRARLLVEQREALRIDRMNPIREACRTQFLAQSCHKGIDQGVVGHMGAHGWKGYESWPGRW